MVLEHLNNIYFFFFKKSIIIIKHPWLSPWRIICTEVKCRPVLCICYFIVPHANAQTRARNKTHTEGETPYFFKISNDNHAGHSALRRCDSHPREITKYQCNTVWDCRICALAESIRVICTFAYWLCESRH